MKEAIAFLFMGGVLIFLFGMMILRVKYMWIGFVFCFIMMVFFATYEPKNKTIKKIKESE